MLVMCVCVCAYSLCHYVAYMFWVIILSSSASGNSRSCTYLTSSIWKQISHQYLLIECNHWMQAHEMNSQWHHSFILVKSYVNDDNGGCKSRTDLTQMSNFSAVWQQTTSWLSNLSESKLLQNLGICKFKTIVKRSEQKILHCCMH